MHGSGRKTYGRREGVNAQRTFSFPFSNNEGPGPGSHCRGMTLLPAEREGRIVMLYHSIAMAVVAIETYIITGLIPMKERQRTTINNTITIGYLLSMIFGLGFAYFGGNWIAHGLFIVGQTLVYFAGVLLAAALWPWKEEYKVKDPAYAHTKNGYDIERIAFFTMAVVTLGSALFGAVAGAYFGNGFESFLAEDVVRDPHKPILQKAIIGHLHIMLSLIGIAITLVVGRWQDFKGGLHKWAMPFMIIGSIILSLGAWAVTLFEWAHVIIYVGSTFAMVAALFFVIFSWDKLIRSGQAERGITTSPRATSSRRSAPWCAIRCDLALAGRWFL